MKRRLVLISEALRLNEVIEAIIGAHEFKTARKGFNQFVKIRGKVAHRSPRLAPHEYNLPEFDKDIADYVLSQEDYVPPLFKDQTHMMEAYRIMIDFMKRTVAFNSKTHAVLEMAITYPALIDSVLSTRLSQLEEE